MMRNSTQCRSCLWVMGTGIVGITVTLVKLLP